MINVTRSMKRKHVELTIVFNDDDDDTTDFQNFIMKKKHDFSQDILNDSPSSNMKVQFVSFLLLFIYRLS